MFKIRIVWNTKNPAVAEKPVFEGWYKRVEMAAVVERALFAYPNDEIKEIKITAASVDVFADTQKAQEAKGKKDN